MSNLINVCKYWKDLEHQNKALNFLQTKISQEDWQEFLKLWRNSNSTSTNKDIILPVPYFSQRVNRPDYYRICNSVVAYMAIRYFYPNTKLTLDNYIRIVNKYGDTTSNTVQTLAMNEVGLKSSFLTNFSFHDLNLELEQNRPVSLGILHRGSETSPTGGGHWIICIGVTADKKTYICHDPWGDINTGYSNTNGNSVRISKSTLQARWQVNGASNGWVHKFSNRPPIK